MMVQEGLLKKYALFLQLAKSAVAPPAPPVQPALQKYLHYVLGPVLIKINTVLANFNNTGPSLILDN